MLPNPSLFGSALSDLLGGGGNRRQRPDYRQSFYLALAKVLAAAAWIDGPINQTEVNVVKRLLNELSPRLTTRELRRVQRYLTEPAPRGHWPELLAQLSEFTRRRARLQFALQRLHDLLACDGEPSPAETHLFNQARTRLGWRESQRGAAGAAAAAAGPEERPAAGGALPSAAAAAGIRLGELGAEACASARAAARAEAPSPALVERLRAAGGGEPPPYKLAVVAAVVAHVTRHRAGTEGEDAELVGFAAAVSAADAALAQEVLEEARRQAATGWEPSELAGALRAWTSPQEIAALAKLLYAMADGEAALRRLRELAAPPVTAAGRPAGRPATRGRE